MMPTPDNVADGATMGGVAAIAVFLWRVVWPNMKGGNSSGGACDKRVERLETGKMDKGQCDDRHAYLDKEIGEVKTEVKGVKKIVDGQSVILGVIQAGVERLEQSSQSSARG